jgi:hypothetical protein
MNDLDAEHLPNLHAIQLAAAHLLDEPFDDIEMVKRLTNLSCLVYTADQAITDNWLGARPKPVMVGGHSHLLDRLGLVPRVDRRF